MIHLAQQEENRNPLGIRYEVGDAAQLEYNKKYDIVFASYLFNYARNQEELAPIVALQATRPSNAPSS